MTERIVSSRFPYLPIEIQIRQHKEGAEAFLDTGFDGDVAVPPGLITDREPPDVYLPWRLADGSEIIAPAYLGTIKVGQIGSFPTLVVALGDEILIGQGIAARFLITLDHGQKVIVEP